MQPGLCACSSQCSCAQSTDVIFTTLLKLPSGERIEMAGCGPATLPCACRHLLTRFSIRVGAGRLSLLSAALLRDPACSHLYTGF